MKNSKGFAISTMMYMILILGLTIVAILLAMFNTRGNILSKLRNNVQDDINDIVESDYICVGIDTIALYQVGDKYKCDLSNTEDAYFYVISSDSNSVNLIMSENIIFGIGNYGNDDDVVSDSKVAYITDTDYAKVSQYKPITALKVLKKITDNWFYLDNRTDTFDGVDYTNYKARLLAFSDITNDNINYISDTLTSSLYENNKIYSVENNETKNNFIASKEFHIVPVITVDKAKLKN